jgi:anti-sigma-K factor RskA
MNRDQLEELASLHALGLLEGEERRAFEQELATNPAAQQLVAELNTAAASLALTAEQVAPPPALRERVLAALPERKTDARAKTPARPVTAPSATATKHARQRDNVVSFRWLPWAVAAGFAIAAGLLFVRNSALERDRESIRGELAAIIIERENLQIQVASLEQRQIMDRLQIASLQTPQGTTSLNATVVAAWDPETKQGLLKFVNLPPAAANRDYQLWVIDPARADPVSAGVVSTAEDGEGRYVFKPTDNISVVAPTFAISDAPKGGEPKPTGTILLVGK